MEARYNVTGEKRKELVTAISQALGIKAKYTFMPKCSYLIGELEIKKDGSLLWSEDMDAAMVETALQAAKDAGFEAVLAEPEATEAEAPTADNITATVTESEQDASAAVTSDTDASAAPTVIIAEPTGLTITVPLDKVAVANLTRILEAKGSLIRKALGIDALPIEIGETTVSFPWFAEAPDADMAKACTDLIVALCRMSREQKRIIATEKPVDNEKYAFRCFLLRLGFIGEEYKIDRKVLLKNLTGSSAFKSGQKREAEDHA